MKKNVTFSLLALSLGLLVNVNAGEETAWAKRSTQDTQAEVNKENKCNFESQLSHYSYMEYMKFNPMQKKKAMDYADNNKMSPDNAVMRVMSETPRH